MIRRCSQLVAAPRLLFEKHVNMFSMADTRKVTVNYLAVFYIVFFVVVVQGDHTLSRKKKLSGNLHIVEVDA